MPALTNKRYIYLNGSIANCHIYLVPDYVSVNWQEYTVNDIIIRTTDSHVNNRVYLFDITPGQCIEFLGLTGLTSCSESQHHCVRKQNFAWLMDELQEANFNNTTEFRIIN